MTDDQINTIIIAVISSSTISVVVNSILNRDLRKANINKIEAEIEKIRIDAQRDLYHVLAHERETLKAGIEKRKGQISLLNLENKQIIDENGKLERKVERLTKKHSDLQIIIDEKNNKSK